MHITTSKKIVKMTLNIIMERTMTIFNNSCRKMLTFPPGELRAGSVNYRLHTCMLRQLTRSRSEQHRRLSVDEAKRNKDGASARSLAFPRDVRGRHSRESELDPGFIGSRERVSGFLNDFMYLNDTEMTYLALTH